MSKKSKKPKPSAKKSSVRRIEVVDEPEDVAGTTDADAAETAAHGAPTAPTGADDAAPGPMDAAADTAQEGADAGATGAEEPRAARKAARAREPRPFAHDPRVTPLVGQTLSHTDRNGTAHTVEVLADGFEYSGQRFKSLSAAAKAATGGKSVNGLLYFGVVKSAARPATKNNPVESLTKAFTKYRDRAEAIAKSAGADQRANVDQAIQEQIGALQQIAAAAQG